MECSIEAYRAKIGTFGNSKQGIKIGSVKKKRKISENPKLYIVVVYPLLYPRYPPAPKTPPGSRLAASCALQQCSSEDDHRYQSLLQPSLPVCQRPICRRNTFSAAQPSDQTISRNRATTSLFQVTIHVVFKDQEQETSYS